MANKSLRKAMSFLRNTPEFAHGEVVQYRLYPHSGWQGYATVKSYNAVDNTYRLVEATEDTSRGTTIKVSADQVRSGMQPLPISTDRITPVTGKSAGKRQVKRPLISRVPSNEIPTRTWVMALRGDRPVRSWAAVGASSHYIGGGRKGYVFENPHLPGMFHVVDCATGTVLGEAKGSVPSALLAVRNQLNMLTPKEREAEFRQIRRLWLRAVDVSTTEFFKAFAKA